MNDESLMPFGKHKGEKMCNVPSDYLLWLFDNGKCYGGVKKYIEDNLDVLQSEVAYNAKCVKKSFKAT